MSDTLDIDDVGEMTCEMDNENERLRELLHRCLAVVPDGEDVFIADIKKELFCE